AEVLRRVRQERDVPGTLERGCQHALVSGAGSRLAARLDLRALGEIAPEAIDLLVVDALGLVDAEVADLATSPIAVVVGSLATGSWARHGFRFLSYWSEGDVIDVDERLVAGGRSARRSLRASGRR